MMRPLSTHGIRINSISPGNVWIDGGSWDNKLKTDPDRVNGIIQNSVALKKFVQPEEIANAVWFTISNPSVTGQNITVDAGQTRQSF
jgi:3-oxoacyl-[acyl-carrier protein] reductase